MGFLSALKAIGTVVETTGAFFDEVRMGQAIGELIVLDRACAKQFLEKKVWDWTSQQFDQFEITFLNASMGMFTREQRIRSMELYAYLKVLETKRHGEWRGFSGATERGALS